MKIENNGTDHRLAIDHHQFTNAAQTTANRSEVKNGKDHHVGIGGQRPPDPRTGSLPAAVKNTDQAALSEAARLLAKTHSSAHLDSAAAENAVTQVYPESRQEKVEALRIQVQHGTYQVPLEALAKLLAERLTQNQGR